VATIIPPRAGPPAAGDELFLRAFVDANSLTRRAFASPPGIFGISAMNSPQIRAASLPSMGGIASAHALAKFYAVLAGGGICEGRVLFKKETLGWMSTRLAQGFDPVLQREMSFSAGFMMDPLDGNGCKIRSLLGPAPSAFGHAGAGGSLGFADPEQGVGFGYVMVLAASPAVAERIGASSRNMFFLRQVVYLAMAAGLMISVSMLSIRQVRLLAWLGLAGALAMVAATLVMGVEIKGARRWLSVPGLGSLQPSEFLKPCFAVVTAWLIAEGKVNRRHGATALAIALFFGIAALMKGQPDIGMLLVIAAVFFAQFFVAAESVVHLRRGDRPIAVVARVPALGIHKFLVGPFRVLGDRRKPDAVDMEFFEVPVPDFLGDTGEVAAL
jgi:hypothetical protein